MKYIEKGDWLRELWHSIIVSFSCHL